MEAPPAAERTARTQTRTQNHCFSPMCARNEANLHGLATWRRLLFCCLLGHQKTRHLEGARGAEERGNGEGRGGMGRESGREREEGRKGEEEEEESGREVGRKRRRVSKETWWGRGASNRDTDRARQQYTVVTLGGGRSGM
eukprot:3074335-Rhodomonas_salina.1